MNWNCKRGPFSVFSKCRKGDAHSNCTLRTTKETRLQYKKAVKKHKKVLAGKLELAVYEEWVRDKNDGVMHDGALLDIIDLEA